MTPRRHQKSGPAKAVEKLAGLLPGRGKQMHGTGRSRRRGKRSAAGLAVFAGAAGLAVKNRDKLTSMLPSRRSREEQSWPADRPPEASILG